MKKLLFAILLLLALPALGGSYTLTTTAAQDAVLADILADTNESVCLYYSQAIGCTQVQARKEFCRRAGSGGVTTCVPNTDPALPPVCTTTPLTADCPGAFQVDIYANVQAFLQRMRSAALPDPEPTQVHVPASVPWISGHAILPGDAVCPPVGPVTYVPSVERVREILYWTRRALSADLDSGVLVSPLGAATALYLLQYLPAVRFYSGPMWVSATMPDGSAGNCCAQGIGAFDGPRVAADDVARTERLVCYESVNWFYGVIQRRDLWDSTATQATVDAVGTQVTGGWRTA